MQSFINNISNFIWNILYNFIRSIYIYSNDPETLSYALRINLLESNFNTFIDKQIISGDLISIGLTWRELILYLIPIILLTFFLIIFVKMVLKVIGLFVEIWQ